MSLDLAIRGLSGLQADVDVNNNLMVTLPTVVTRAGFAFMAGQIPGPAASARPVDVSAEGRPHVALDRPVFYASFGGSATPANAIQQDAWKQTATTMAVSSGSFTGGFLLLNGTSITTPSTGVQYQSYAVFPTYGGYGTRYEFAAATVNGFNAANKTIELGVGLTTDAKTNGLLDGACFRWNSAGEFRGIMSINGTEYTTAALTVPSDNVVHRYTMVMNQTGLDFKVDGQLVATLNVPSDQPGAGLQPNLPLLMRVYNSAVTPALPPQLKVAECWVSQTGIDWGKPWAHILAGMAQHCVNVPYGQAMPAGGASTNNQSGTAGGAAIAATAAGSNTAALITGLGGVGRMTAQATNIAAAGYMNFFSYQVPAITATQGSKRLHITGLWITCSNGGAVIATTPTCLIWALAWGHTAVSLATADAVGAKGPRFLPLGQMYGAIGNVIGQGYDKDIVRSFQTPIVVNPGEFVALVVRFLQGTATASQEVVTVAGFEGYWE
jgi:hypothetical protein